jgi:hypothetical protein
MVLPVVCLFAVLRRKDVKSACGHFLGSKNITHIKKDVDSSFDELGSYQQ